MNNYDNFLPPEDVVSGVNPFSGSLRRILTGIALWIIKLNFMYLNYILPLFGILLIFTGFRSLKKENKWFSACFFISIFLLAEFSSSLIINTTIYHKEIYQTPLMLILSVISIILSFAMFFAFGKGIKAVQKKSALPEGAGGVVALITWYAVLCALALLQYNGIIIGIIMLVAFVFILISLYDLSKALNEAGYILTPPVLKIPNWLICSFITFIIVAGCISGYALRGKYNMQWEPLSPTAQEDVKAHLAALGFPEKILNDLSENDLLACSDALEVKVESKLHPMNKGREVTTLETISGRKTYIHTTVYDRKELCVTSVAVKLPTERETWKIFHHFAWEITPPFYGTECVRIIPAYTYGSNLGWSDGKDLSGRLLYDLDNITYTAPFHSLSSQFHTADDMFFGQSTSEDIYGAFSFPNKGINHRGYVCYTTMANQPGWILSSQMNYSHKTPILEYPNETAMDNTLKSFLDKSEAYISAQDAIQFFTK